jgi:hypothetical protein
MNALGIRFTIIVVVGNCTLYKCISVKDSQVTWLDSLVVSL